MMRLFLVLALASSAHSAEPTPKKKISAAARKKTSAAAKKAAKAPDKEKLMKFAGEVAGLKMPALTDADSEGEVRLVLTIAADKIRAIAESL